MRSVVIGAGIAGMSLAVELSRLGVDVTVVEARYIGAGNTTRNVGRVRRMQLTEELTEFSCRASDKWERVDRLTGGRNPLLYPTSYVWSMYGEDELAVVRPLQTMWKRSGAQAQVVSSTEILDAVPVLRGGDRPVGGVIGAAHIVHHDAAVYAYFLFAKDAGITMLQGTPARELTTTTDGHVSGVTLADGRHLPADVVVNAAGASSGALARSLGVDAPNQPLRREVLVCEPSKPFMRPAVTFYRPQEGWFNQTLRGELVAGVVDPDEQFGTPLNESSPQFLGRTARVVLQKAPRLAHLRVVRQWAGAYDTTPDRHPLVGEHPDRPGFYALNGWSGRGILIAPFASELLARELAGRGRDPLLDAFDPARFTGQSAAVSPHHDYYAGYAH